MHGLNTGRNVICIHKIFDSIQQTYKEELCARFWVKGFEVKVDQYKGSLYLKRAISLVLTKSWPLEVRDMIRGRGGHVEPWALPLGAACPPLHPCWKAGQLAMLSREQEVWIFMFNLLISVLATPPPPPRKMGTKSPQQCAGISLQSLQVFISHLELGV